MNKTVKSLNAAIKKLVKCGGNCKSCDELLIPAKGNYYAFCCGIGDKAGYCIYTNSIKALYAETLTTLQDELIWELQHPSKPSDGGGISRPAERTSTMTKLNAIAILSPAKKPATLIAIDVDTKTCIIDKDGEEKTILWTTAAAYKTADTGKPLTGKLLTSIHAAGSDQQADEVTAAEDSAPEPVCEPQEGAKDTSPKDTTPTTNDAQRAAEPASKPKRTRTPKGTINDKEKMLLSTIPTLADFKGVDSEMGARALLKKAEALHGLPLVNGRAVFASLKGKGYYTTKGMEFGQRLTTFSLSEMGVKYLTENNLLADVGAAPQEQSA